MTSVSNHFSETFDLYKQALKNGKPAYLTANNKTFRIEFNSKKIMSLCEVFQKALIYLKNEKAAPTKIGLKKQVEQLDSLLKDGTRIIAHYNKKSNTWCRWLLKLINAYAPKILKNHFPHIFSNRIQEAEQNTRQAFQQYEICVKNIKDECKLQLDKLAADNAPLAALPEKIQEKVLKKDDEAQPKSDNLKKDNDPSTDAPLPEKIQEKVLKKDDEAQPKSDNLTDDRRVLDTFMRKTFKEGLLKRERAVVLQVCKNWTTQLEQVKNQENQVIKNLIQSIINDGLEGQKFASIVTDLKNILKNKELTDSPLTLSDRLQFTNKSISQIFAQNYALLKDHIKIVKITVAQDGWALWNVSTELRGIAEIIKIAVTQNGRALWFASAELKDNNEIAKIAVAQNGRALEFVSDRLKENIDIVKIAIAKDGRALEFVSDRLKEDINIVKIAVAQNGDALRHASEELKNNIEIVTIAVTKHGEALKYASAELRNNVELAKIASSHIED